MGDPSPPRRFQKHECRSLATLSANHPAQQPYGGSHWLGSLPPSGSTGLLLVHPRMLDLSESLPSVKSVKEKQGAYGCFMCGGEEASASFFDGGRLTDEGSLKTPRRGWPISNTAPTPAFDGWGPRCSTPMQIQCDAGTNATLIGTAQRSSTTRSGSLPQYYASRCALGLWPDLAIRFPSLRAATSVLAANMRRLILAATRPAVLLADGGLTAWAGLLGFFNPVTWRLDCFRARQCIKGLIT